MITLLFGPPGSGKGTQASVVASRFGIPHVSTGEILRSEVAAGTALGKEAAPIMASGHLVPDELMVRIIESRLMQPDAQSGALLDGYPRTRAQAQALDEMLARGGRPVDVVVALDVPEEALRRRILRRAELEGRSDDSADAFTIRMRRYLADTEPVLDHYTGRGVRLAHVDGIGDIDTVTRRIADVLDKVDMGKTP